LLPNTSLDSALSFDLIVIPLFFLLLNGGMRMICGVFFVKYLLSNLFELLSHVTRSRIIVLVDVNHYIVVVDGSRRRSALNS
jgi:hypothetical protein